MQNQFFNKTKIMCGNLALNKIAFELKKLNSTNVLIVCDNLTERLGYLKVFKKALYESYLSIKSVVISAEDVGSELEVQKIATMFSDSGYEAIIAIGNKNVINVCKAVKIVIARGAKTIQDLSDIVGIDKIPLIIVPTILGNGNEATMRAYIYDTAYNNCYDISSKNIAPDAVVIDKRMMDSLPINTIIEFGLYALNMSLCAYIDDQTSIFAKGYAFTAIKLVRKALLEPVKINPKKATQDLMLAIVLAGVAFAELDKCLLNALAIECSRFKKVSDMKVFNSLLPHYLDMLMNKNNVQNKDLLLGVIGLDEYIKIDDDERSCAIIEVLNKINTDFCNAYGYKFRLSDLNITSADIEKIVTFTLDNPELEKNEENKIILSELLNRAL